MGSHDYIITYNISDKKKVVDQWAYQVDEDSYESGNGAYAGNATTLGKDVDFRDKRLSDEDAAREYILEHHNKWSSPIGCSFYISKPRTESQNKKVKRLSEKVFELQRKRASIINGLQETFFNRKSDFVGCKCCGSKLRITYLKAPECPLCRKSLLSNTDQKKIETAELALEKARAAYKESMIPKPSKDIGWAVGGWAAC